MEAKATEMCGGCQVEGNKKVARPLAYTPKGVETGLIKARDRATRACEGGRYKGASAGIKKDGEGS